VPRWRDIIPRLEKGSCPYAVKKNRVSSIEVSNLFKATVWNYKATLSTITCFTGQIPTTRNLKLKIWQPPTPGAQAKTATIQPTKYWNKVNNNIRKNTTNNKQAGRDCHSIQFQLDRERGQSQIRRGPTLKGHNYRADTLIYVSAGVIRAERWPMRVR
jgi:hypothetical protein